VVVILSGAKNPLHSNDCLLLLKAMGSFRLRLQDDISGGVILSETKNPIHTSDCLLLLKAMGSFGLRSQDDKEAAKAFGLRRYHFAARYPFAAHYPFAAIISLLLQYYYLLIS
jgi:hypothetical protein